MRLRELEREREFRHIERVSLMLTQRMALLFILLMLLVVLLRGR